VPLVFVMFYAIIITIHVFIKFRLSYCFVSQAHQNYGGYDGVAMNRKYKYSRFKPIKTYKDVEKGSLYTCCTFSVKSMC